MLRKKDRPKPVPIPQVGTRGEVHYGMYRLACSVIQVAGAGMLVKVEIAPHQMPLGDRGIYVFKREADGGSYQRKAPGRIAWFLEFERLRGV